ncbi:MAG TPA: trypsin-like peptidase domain-containing protein [Thermoanaerobaculia bacterium]|nr:trypsin-like peptidase domain-containing protein [Thermoanaerobaculia bacterium]
MNEHLSRSSEEPRAAAVFEKAIVAEPAQPLATAVEDVPGYQKPGQGTARLRVIAGDEKGILVRDAADVAFGNRLLMESVIGGDDRVAIRDTRQLPWRFICALRMHMRDGSDFVGTGWFIGEKTVMTAGHCVFVHDHGGFPERIEVIPGLDRTFRPFGSAVGRRFRAPQGWIDNADTNVDYGAIQLDTPLGRRTGFFAFGALSDAQLRETDANISGYPGDRDQASRQYFHARTIQQTNPTRLFYDIDTFGGQSGSPIFLNVSGRRVAVGIHTTGGSRSNSGTRITADVFNNMNTWRNE